MKGAVCMKMKDRKKAQDIAEDRMRLISLRGRVITKERNPSTMRLEFSLSREFVGEYSSWERTSSLYECCQQGLKTYFIKASELRDKLTNARKAGKTASCLNSLVRPSCLIIDEIGHCEFDRENTRLFFDLVDRRYNKEGSFNTVFTSNKNPARWRDIFNEDDALLCALDRIFDDAELFKIRGESFRGKQLVTMSFQTSRVKEFNPTKAEVK